MRRKARNKGAVGKGTEGGEGAETQTGVGRCFRSGKAGLEGERRRRSGQRKAEPARSRQRRVRFPSGEGGYCFWRLGNLRKLLDTFPPPQAAGVW